MKLASLQSAGFLSLHSRKSDDSLVRLRANAIVSNQKQMMIRLETGRQLRATLGHRALWLTAEAAAGEVCGKQHTRVASGH